MRNRRWTNCLDLNFPNENCFFWNIMKNVCMVRIQYISQCFTQHLKSYVWYPSRTKRNARQTLRRTTWRESWKLVTRSPSPSRTPRQRCPKRTSPSGKLSLLVCYAACVLCSAVSCAVCRAVLCCVVSCVLCRVESSCVVCSVMCRGVCCVTTSRRVVSCILYRVVCVVVCVCRLLCLCRESLTGARGPRGGQHIPTFSLSERMETFHAHLGTCMILTILSTCRIDMLSATAESGKRLPERR